MAWLDRDRMPVRFTVTTSVASGLILAAILATFRTGFTESITITRITLASGGVAAISLLAFSGLSHLRKRSKRAFLITSAFSQKYFLAAFVQRMHRALDRDRIDLVLKVPDRDYDASAQSHHLNRLLDRRHEYLGGVILATEVHRVRDDLARFCRKSRLPIVFTDIKPFDRESEYPHNTAYLGYDTGELGELAGQWLVKHLRNRDRPRVLIIASREHSARQQRCEKTLRSALPDVTIAIDDSCEFNRSRAHHAVRAHLRQLTPAQRLDAIFCTNDEMALGAVDALASRLPATRTTVVMGIDGVLEAKALIDTADSPLKATVVQDTHRLAMNITDLLEKMRRGHPVPKRTILPAEIYESS